MSDSLVTSVSGWIQIPLFCMLVPLPYLLRWRDRRSAGRRAGRYLERIRPHISLGL